MSGNGEETLSVPLMPRLAPILTPKHAGDTLLKALPYVQDMYGKAAGLECRLSSADLKSISAAANQLKKDPHRAQVYGRFLHLTVHTLPQMPQQQRILRYCVLACLLCSWLVAYPRALQLRCLMVASVYSGMESTFTFFERGRPFTSFEQFWGNLLYIPVLLDLYGVLLGKHMIAYIILFPFNIWLLEIVLGYFYIWTFGHNVAWCYLDYSDSYFTGNIRLGHGVFWLALGAICFFFYPMLVNATALAF